jgi:two-component system phosphate regulon sensor histidine kinase PhoR
MQRTVILKDTSRIKKLFTGTIREVDPSIRITWTTDQPPWDTTVIKQKRFFYEMPAQGYRLAATVANPFLIVLKEILPSTLFALALLILTGLSFVIAFRNLKSQIRLNRIRSDFMSNVTHELKTPVSTVTVALEALRKVDMQSDPATKAEYLEIASREISRLDQLISQVLKLSMYDNGSQVMEKEEVDLWTVASDVVKILRPALENQGAKIHLAGNAGSCIIRADRLHVQGVVTNLLENCMNYGGERPKILVTMDQSDRAVTLIVADDGPGIPEEYLEKVFDKFFRVPNGDRHNVKGYGLGLSYASMVMKLHGGSIRAENLREGGVRFILTFPRES